MKFLHMALLVGLTVSITSGQSIAAGPNAAVPAVPNVPDMVLSPSDQALAKDVSVLENRFFFHSYGHDPMEKRIERLELLTLGAAQGGLNAERLVRLKQAVIERDKEAAKTMAREQKGDGDLAAKTNYPILGTLEWRVLKKTYPSESIDQRLGRMESQLFGVPAQAMSYVDRIERLKKTIGLDIAGGSPATAPKSAAINRQLGMGGPPMPRAGHGNSFGGNFGNGFGSGMQIQIGPNGIIGPGITTNPGNGGSNGNGNKSGYLYDEHGNVTGWYQNNSQSWSFPGNGGGGGNGGGSGQNVFEAMDQMNRQMSEMMRSFNNPGFGGDSFIITPPQGLRQVTPGTPASPKILPSPQPIKKFTSPNRELPPYTDPNSI